MANEQNSIVSVEKKDKGLLFSIRQHYILYIMLLISVVWIIVFKYIPMYGIIIAFQNFSIRKGYFGSEFVGLKHFIRFFNSSMFTNLLGNTLILSIYTMVANFICPILLALMINEVDNKRFKKAFQMVSYIPHFISTVIVVSMLQRLFSMEGLFNNILAFLGAGRASFFGNVQYYRHLYVWSGVWAGVGYGTVIYIAALSKVDVELYDAAKIDGATRFQKVKYIDLPSILPTITILLILSVGSIMNVGFEKSYLMQNNTNLRVSEIISTYVYKVGLISSQYSFSAAVDFFNSVVNVILLVLVNYIAGKVSETSLW